MGRGWAITGRSAIIIIPWPNLLKCHQEQQLPGTALDTPLPPAGMRKGNSASPYPDIIFKVAGANSDCSFFVQDLVLMVYFLLQSFRRCVRNVDRGPRDLEKYEWNRDERAGNLLKGARFRTVHFKEKKGILAKQKAIPSTDQKIFPREAQQQKTKAVIKTNFAKLWEQRATQILCRNKQGGWYNL